MAKTSDETDSEEDRQRLADRVLSIFEDAMYWAIAVVLVAGSVALLVAQFNTMLRLRSAAASTVMLEILDGLLLIFIFVELLYAVRACLRSHEIVAEPFLIVGILAAIKEIVVLSVEAATLLEKGPEFSRAVVEIGVLGAVVLVLALAAFVLRARLGGGEAAGRSIRDRRQAVLVRVVALADVPRRIGDHLPPNGDPSLANDQLRAPPRSAVLIGSTTTL